MKKGKIKNLIKNENEYDNRRSITARFKIQVYVIGSFASLTVNIILALETKVLVVCGTGSEKTQIEYMTKIHDSFRENEKPEWLTMEQIKEYSNAMGVTQE